MKKCNSCKFFDTDGDRGMCTYFHLQTVKANWNDEACLHYIRMEGE